MPSVGQKIANLTRQLYPTGRAFKIPSGGNFDKLHRSLNSVYETAVTDGVDLFNSILPDNDGFTAEDATDWERRLGLIYSPTVSLSNRKAAIIQKLNYPGVNPAKGHYLYVESQLQLAGFNVYVYENRFPVYPSGYETMSPVDITGDPNLLFEIQHGMIQHGEGQTGSLYKYKVANHIDESKDLLFSVGANLKSTFFIGGSPIGTNADVPSSQKDQFRQLILRLKHVQTVAFLFINYT